DRILMLENAWYSVISPEMCATILWRDSSRAAEAAQLLRLTPMDLLKFGIIDDVITEPLGGAHRDHAFTGMQIRSFMRRYLATIMKIPVDRLVDQRLARFRKIGQFNEQALADL
ncbi:MAG TPA: acetyl-CoA carboxylase carboxyl transferase subunit alpha, partial [Firmicutes bacterium]|nr:acetyl-CoA carboxylase carboxyl transferase subunit alpha [Bacillota bacterium]